MCKTAAFGVWVGSLNRFLSVCISILSTSSVSVLFSTHASALLSRPGIVRRSCSSRRTRDSTLFSISLDAMVLIVAVDACVFCLLDFIFSACLPLLVL